jgi:biotin-dependent carboxylase-like uncharacterized protein
MSLHVLEPGLYSLVVDLGRPGSRSLGVPVGGAADRTSLMFGNTLVGNSPDAAGMEISLTGPTLRAECDLACVVFGPPFDLRCGVRDLQTGKTFTLHAGEILRIGGTPEGMRAYLCVRGGIQAPVIMGSRSAVKAIQKGEIVHCLPGTIADRFVRPPAELCSWVKSRAGLRTLDGGQSRQFSLHQFYGSPGGGAPPEFTVSPESDRTGLRLLGNSVSVPDEELPSEPVCPGTVQVTRSECILFGMECGTIGGYHKIAQVISADLDRVGQLRPGDKVSFLRVSLDEAQALYRAKTLELHRWLTRLQVAGAV